MNFNESKTCNHSEYQISIRFYAGIGILFRRERVEGSRRKQAHRLRSVFSFSVLGNRSRSQALSRRKTRNPCDAYIVIYGALFFPFGNFGLTTLLQAMVVWLFKFRRAKRGRRGCWRRVGYRLLGTVLGPQRRLAKATSGWDEPDERRRIKKRASAASTHALCHADRGAC